MNELEKEKKRIAQSIARKTKGTKQRKWMMDWNNSEKFKECYAEYWGNGGREAKAKYVKKVLLPKRKQANKKLIESAKNGKKEWTASDEMKLLEMQRLGRTYIEMAKELSRSYKSIDHKFRRLKRINDDFIS